MIRLNTIPLIARLSAFELKQIREFPYPAGTREPNHTAPVSKKCDTGRKPDVETLTYPKTGSIVLSSDLVGDAKYGFAEAGAPVSTKISRWLAKH